MTDFEANNPYRPPEASIAALRSELGRPTVYTAISIFCWIMSAFSTLFVAGSLCLLGMISANFGWRWILHTQSGPRHLLTTAAAFLGSIAYVTASRLLWSSRGTPGMILCSIGVGLTYLCVWLLTSR